MNGSTPGPICVLFRKKNIKNNFSQQVCRIVSHHVSVFKRWHRPKSFGKRCGPKIFRNFFFGAASDFTKDDRCWTRNGILRRIQKFRNVRLANNIINYNNIYSCRYNDNNSFTNTYSTAKAPDLTPGRDPGTSTIVTSTTTPPIPKKLVVTSVQASYFASTTGSSTTAIRTTTSAALLTTTGRTCLKTLSELRLNSHSYNDYAFP